MPFRPEDFGDLSGSHPIMQLHRESERAHTQLGIIQRDYEAVRKKQEALSVQVDSLRDVIDVTEALQQRLSLIEQTHIRLAEANTKYQRIVTRWLPGLFGAIMALIGAVTAWINGLI